jgi:4-amino-4-deoxy-L-arabinose transferase-like glycosyltransferase
MAKTARTGAKSKARPPHEGVWRRRLTGTFAAGAVLAGFWGLMLSSLADKSATGDEIVHAAGGYTYWRFGDYRINPENGNLPQRWMALPLVTSDYRFPSRESEAWSIAQEWLLGDQWFHSLGNDVAGMLRRGRAASGLIAVALGALLWSIARRLFGPEGGMLSLVVYALSPTVLANGALMTADTAAALFFLLSTWSLWAALHRLTALRAIAAAVAAGGLFVSKMSAVVFVPVALALVAARLIDGRPLDFGKAGRELRSRRELALAFAALLAAYIVVVPLVVWSCYGFRYSAFAGDTAGGGRFFEPWEFVLDRPGPGSIVDRLGLEGDKRAAALGVLERRGASRQRWTYAGLDALADIERNILAPGEARALGEAMSLPPEGFTPRVLDFLRRNRILPEAYVYGHAYVWKFSRQRSAFMNGEFHLFGWKTFFPYTFLVKTPLMIFGLIGLAAAALVRTRRFYDTLPLWVLMVFYWAAVIPSQINIGHRHILPVYPPLFILCGAAALWLRAEGRARNVLRAAPVVLAVLLATEALYRYPNYLAYFNVIAGGPARGYRRLIDSSLDWGQDLPGLRRYLDRQPGSDRAYLSYFGNARPSYYQIPAVHLPSDPGWDLLGRPLLHELRLPPEQVDAFVSDLSRPESPYEVAGTTPAGREVKLVLLKKSDELRLAPGTYFISASMLQPVRHASGGPWGPWNQVYENAYQELYRTMRPLLADERGLRLDALARQPPAGWNRTWEDFEKFRFARLTAYLRQLEPDDTVNFSILVYRLDADELARALDGPPAELERYVLKELLEKHGATTVE